MDAGEPALSRRGRLLTRAFYDRPPLEVARELLGAVVTHVTAEGSVSVRLTEVEAYAGAADPGSHAFRGRTPRVEVMFGPPGHCYVYFTYGMHWCMNLVCLPAGTASAVLLRAGEVIEGVDLARVRRPGARDRDLARGPARLTRALGVTGSLNGTDVTRKAGRDGITVQAGLPVPGEAVVLGPRTGVGGAGSDFPWRFSVEGEPTVSTYRRAAPRRRRQPSQH